MKENYNKDQCVYGPDSKRYCIVYSAMCKERYNKEIY